MLPHTMGLQGHVCHVTYSGAAACSLPDNPEALGLWVVWVFTKVSGLGDAQNQSNF